ncbi:RNA methyltransferase [Streptomyces sp. NBC_01808]|uniref:TrmH family RNA methyltransferase n=1 Tax=Streptomyces sp. NBC_01808 TaxID=2975947 RepID=UPI002DDBD738|nr:RNA methyltransferase [Streptomyces sp. NBC_01808]WSA39095.1 RNA methyltransferase [Streptomyces sp. NBC_01808]
MSAEVVREWREAVADDRAVLLDGFHALKHALRFGARVRIAVTASRADARALAGELAPDLADRLDALLAEVPDRELRELVPRRHPTGVAALADRPEPAAVRAALRAPRSAPVVVLDNPRNLGNVGAVVRLAAGMGAAGVVTTGDADPWHPNAVRGAAGLHYATAVARLPLGDLPDAAPGPLYALDPAGDDLRTLRLPPGVLLAFGSERHGISPALRTHADRLVSLPMRPQVSSYNLATSVAMTLYHWSQTEGPDTPAHR